MYILRTLQFVSYDHLESDWGPSDSVHWHYRAWKHAQCKEGTLYGPRQGGCEVPQCIWVSATADFELETLTSANCFGTLPFSLIGCAAVQCQFPSYLRLTSGGPASRGYRVKRQFLLNAHLLCYCKVWKAVSCRIRWSEQLTDLCSVSSLFIKKFGGGTSDWKGFIGKAVKLDLLLIFQT